LLLIGLTISSWTALEQNGQDYFTGTYKVGYTHYTVLYIWREVGYCKVKKNITINVPLFKKLRDIIFFWWENHFMSHFEGHFEGAKTFLTH
jgi:hypothetical protein